MVRMSTYVKKVMPAMKNQGCLSRRDILDGLSILEDRGIVDGEDSKFELDGKGRVTKSIVYKLSGYFYRRLVESIIYLTNRKFQKSEYNPSLEYKVRALIMTVNGCDEMSPKSPTPLSFEKMQQSVNLMYNLVPKDKFEQLFEEMLYGPQLD